MAKTSGADPGPAARRRVVVVGGGFTGACVGVQLARRADCALDIAVVEARERVGPGLAYSADDPDHRLNGSIDSHLIDPADPGELRRWCEASGVLARDPGALAPNGAYYIRRGDFGAFVEDALRRAAAGGVHSIRHVRGTATRLVAPAQAGAQFPAPRFELRLADGRELEADLVVIATGNGGARLPPGFEAALASHPAMVADALRTERLRAIAPEARVLMVGGGLTALDAISTLLGRGHRGGIVAISRHGIRPRPQRTPPGVRGDGTAATTDGPLPEFIARLGPAPTVRGLTRALRARIERCRAEGREWQAAFDELRDVVWRVWPAMPLAEKRRFLRLLRPWYDAHRFRAPPQNAAMVEAAERRGEVEFRVGRVLRAAGEGARIRVAWREDGRERSEAFDAVVNCTGLDAACGAADNPFLAGLLAGGRLVRDPCGFGFAVDGACRPLDARGAPLAGVRMFGPPTAGTFGDPLGVLFIAPQVARAVPGMLAELATAAETRCPGP